MSTLQIRQKVLINSNMNKNKEIKKSGVGTRILLCVYYVAACCFFPASLYLDMSALIMSVVCFVACALSASALALAAGSWHKVLGFTVPVFVLVFLGGAVLPISLAAVFIAAVCVYAFLLVKHPSPFMWGLPIIALALSVFIGGEIQGMIASVATLPCAVALAFSVKKRRGRVGTVCAMSACICAVIVAAFAVSVYSIFGGVSLEAIRALFDAFKKELVVSLTEGTTTVLDKINNAQMAVGDVTQYVEAAVRAAFNLLPAIIIVISNALSYMIHSLLLAVAFGDDIRKKENISMLEFDMSIVSAFVYIAAAVGVLTLSSDKLALYGAAAENIFFILVPGYIIIALGALRVMTTKNGPSCFGTLLYIGVVFSLLSFSLPAILIVSAAGVIFRIISHFANKKRLNKNG